MALSPMMQEFLRCKEEYKDCILFYRVGDFYETFFDDAKTAAKELELTLTGKDCGLPERAPMAGVPYHAVDVYIDRMVKKGYKVAICDQVEDPREAKGLVKREVTRVVTPGTNVSATGLSEDRNQYLVCLLMMGDRFGIAASDISTGEFAVTEAESARTMQDELLRYDPAELIVSESVLLAGYPDEDTLLHLSCRPQVLPSRFFLEENGMRALTKHFAVSHPDALGLGALPLGGAAAGALLLYLAETQKTDLLQITDLKIYTVDQFMLLDHATVRNLELVETMREKKKQGSLLWVLDRTKTAMGARYLRSMIERPLIDEKEIVKRLDALESLNAEPITRDEIREYLQPVYDLERLSSRVASHMANPRDLLALRNSLAMLPPIRDQVKTLSAGIFQRMGEELETLEDICALISRAITDDPPLAMKEGGIIREGYSEDVDEYRRARSEGATWLAEIEEKERRATGIHTLKVKFNRVFGYCIEVTNSFRDMVPDRYIRKQTLVGAERYTTQELKEVEDKILGAQDKLYSLEYELFAELREKIAGEMHRLRKTASGIALLDALCSLAYVSQANRYVRPKIRTDQKIVIRDGRHPVVERMVREDGFVPNDTVLDCAKERIAIITGPNMAGKSTYMRQVALIVLMAQIGSFVPASAAEIGIVDRIFTRVGASDDLASGQSTFMVEMTEVANILRNATQRSLLILDEIGRGTSTFDGLSIAWAVVEYVANRSIIGAKTLFATHYHELTELEGKIDGVSNYCIAVKEKGDSIVFLRKIVKGGADKSYGIQVARLAGLPEAVLVRAQDLVSQLSDADITDTIRKEAGTKKKAKKAIHYDDVDLMQMSLFDTTTDESVLGELETLDIGNLTPVEALNILYRLQNKLKNRWRVGPDA